MLKAIWQQTKTILNSLDPFEIDFDPIFYQGRQYQVCDSTPSSSVQIFNETIQSSHEEVNDIIKPDEILLKILEYVDFKTLVECALVNKRWQRLANNNRFEENFYQKIPSSAFTWTGYGNVGEIPPIKRKHLKILNGLKKDHTIALIPKTINDQPFTLKKMIEVFESKLGKKTFFVDNSILEKYGDTPVQKSHWIVVGNEILEESREKTFNQQKELITQLAKPDHLSLVLPGVLEIAITKGLRICRSNNGSLPDDDIMDESICQESIKDFQVSVKRQAKGVNINVHTSLTEASYYTGMQRIYEL